jgi:hypothetical protein
MYEKLFGRPRDLWAEVLVDEISAAKLARMDWEEHLANRGTPPPNPSDLAEGVPVDKPTGKPVTKPMVYTLVYRDGDTAFIEFRSPGQPQPDGWITASIEPAGNGPTEYVPELAAACVLARSTWKLVDVHGGDSTLPPYVHDTELVLWLIERLGFGGGGGPKATLSTASMVALVADPQGLVASIREYGARRAERATDTEAVRLEASFASLADRIEQLALNASSSSTQVGT